VFGKGNYIDINGSVGDASTEIFYSECLTVSKTLKVPDFVTRHVLIYIAP